MSTQTDSHSSIAAVVLAHNDPAQFQRLLAALAPAPVFLHCDAATPAAELAAMTAGATERVTVIDRIRGHRGGWSLVQAELNALAVALERSQADYIVMMSGSCYPLVSMPALEAELAATPGQSRINYWSLPHEPWGARLGIEGGLWRVRLRYLSFGERPVRIQGRPVPVGRARVPAGLELHGGSQWKVYARAHARALLDAVDTHPELRRFFRTSFTPDESCVPSILNSPAFVGAVAETLVPARPWYLEFPSSREEGQDAHGHGDWLDVGSFAAMANASAPAGEGHSHYQRALFARKFRTAQAGLLDRVDRELRERA